MDGFRVVEDADYIVRTKREDSFGCSSKVSFVKGNKRTTVDFIEAQDLPSDIDTTKPLLTFYRGLPFSVTRFVPVWDGYAVFISSAFILDKAFCDV
jgi:hypothetical protein